MKGCRKCRDGPASDLHDAAVRHMAAVNKGARKIMTEMPDQLTAVFAWTVFAGAFIFVLLTATCLVLKYESRPSDGRVVVVAGVPRPARSVPQEPAARESCTKDYPLTAGRRRRRASKLMTLQDIGAGDVHLVLAHDARVPWSHACSLESVLRAAGNESRVNAFIVHGGVGQRLRNERGQNDGSNLVSLSSSLADLDAAYERRLNVVHVHLDECLEYTPFRDTDPNEMSTELATLAVQLAVLWQFGGTTLDAGTVAVRGEVYRAQGAAVEYGDRTVSSPVACHAFVYDMMLRTKSFEEFDEPIWTGGVVADRTIAWTGRGVTGKDARRVVDLLECDRGVVEGRCYYAWCPADRDVPRRSDSDSVRRSCPVVSETVADRLSSPPRP